MRSHYRTNIRKVLPHTMYICYTWVIDKQEDKIEHRYPLLVKFFVKESKTNSKHCCSMLKINAKHLAIIQLKYPV